MTLLVEENRSPDVWYLRQLEENRSADVWCLRQLHQQTFALVPHRHGFVTMIHWHCITFLHVVLLLQSNFGCFPHLILLCPVETMENGTTVVLFNSMEKFHKRCQLLAWLLDECVFNLSCFISRLLEDTWGSLLLQVAHSASQGFSSSFSQFYLNFSCLCWRSFLVLSGVIWCVNSTF